MKPTVRFAGALLAVLPAALPAQTAEHASQTIKLSAEVRSVGLAGNANRVAAVGSDKNLTVWDLASGKLLRTIPLETADNNSTLVSRDGRFILTGDRTGNVVVWDAGSGKSLFRQNLLRYASAACFSADGKLLAIAPAGQPVQVFEVGSFRKVSETQAVAGGVESIAFSRDGAFLATADADTAVRVYHARTGKLISENRDFLVLPLALDFTADGKQVIAASGDRLISFIDAGSGELIRRLPKTEHPVFFSGLRVSPDGKHVGVMFMKAENMTQSAPVATWEVLSGEKTSEWLPPTMVFGSDWTGDGHLLTVGMQAPDTLVIWRDR